MSRVLVADALAPAGVEELARHFDVDVRTGLDKAALLAIIGTYDGVVVRSATTLDAEVIAAGERLQVIARAGIGLDNVDVAAATAQGVLVCNAPQSNVVSAAEHTIALLLALARRVPAAHASLTAGDWQRSAFSGTELHGKTLGVVGMGRVGTLVAQRAAAFGMALVAYDPFLSADRAGKLGVALAPTVEELCATADVVTVHLPRTPDTVGMIGAGALRRMQPTALLVNAARGGIVDEAALHTALTHGWIAGAALDVFDAEPTTDSLLFGLDNVVVTPHLGASTVEAQDKAGVMVADALRRALVGEPVPEAVNLPVAVSKGSGPSMRLAETLGRVYAALHAGPLDTLTVELWGAPAADDTRALALAFQRGLLATVEREPVSLVNVAAVAEERGISLTVRATTEPRDYASLVRVAGGDGGVAGTLTGPDGDLRLTEVWGYPVDLGPARHLLFLRCADRAGLVGTVGELLGRARIDIAGMQVVRCEDGGETLIAVAVESVVPAGVLDHLATATGALRTRQLDLAA